MMLKTLLFIAMGATAATLVAGLYVMAKGGELSRRYSHSLMQWRVLLQGLALLLFAALLYW